MDLIPNGFHKRDVFGFVDYDSDMLFNKNTKNLEREAHLPRIGVKLV